MRNADRPQFLVFVDETEKLGGKVIAARQDGMKPSGQAETRRSEPKPGPDSDFELGPDSPGEFRLDETVPAASYGLLDCVDGMTGAAQAAPSAHPLRQAPSSLRIPL